MPYMSKDSQSDGAKMPLKEWARPELVEVDSEPEDVNGLFGPVFDGVESITS